MRPNNYTSNTPVNQHQRSSYADALKSKNPKHQQQFPDVSTALNDILKRLTDIDNKLITLNDEIITAKNEIIILQENQEDIDYHITKLEKYNNIVYTKGVYDSDMEFDDSQEPPLESTFDRLPSNLSTNTSPLDKVTSLENQFTESRSEIKNIANSIQQILQTLPSSSK